MVARIVVDAEAVEAVAVVELVNSSQVKSSHLESQSLVTLLSREKTFVKEVSAEAEVIDWSQC